jgi:Reverse transcriptase (RNA-dependent DNA polymerase)
LPQGSPLSPVLFLFFNADLVQHRIDSSGGSMAFVDDYTAWVTGSTAEANREGIQAIINEALDWEKRSGATFKGKKTTLVHFTRCRNRSSTTPITIKEEVVTLKETAKILEVTIDSKLRYKQHIASAATKGLLAAMALKRLQIVSPLTARQLFESTVAPVVDYASNIWMYTYGTAGMASLNRVQRVGAQAIIGSFRTVAVAVAETEASIRTVRERHADRATKLWVGLHTLPKTNPLSRISTRILRRFTSPLQKIAQAHEDIPTDTVETIQEHAISP